MAGARNSAVNVPKYSVIYVFFALVHTSSLSNAVQICQNTHEYAFMLRRYILYIHMSEVITFVFKVLRHGQLRYIPLHMCKPVITFVVQSATQ